MECSAQTQSNVLQSGLNLEIGILGMNIFSHCMFYIIAQHPWIPEGWEEEEKKEEEEGLSCPCFSGLSLAAAPLG